MAQKCCTILCANPHVCLSEQLLSFFCIFAVPHKVAEGRDGGSQSSVALQRVALSVPSVYSVHGQGV